MKFRAFWVGLFFAIIAAFVFGLAAETANATDAAPATSFTVRLTSSATTLSDLRAVFPHVKFRPLFSATERKALAEYRRSALGSTLLVGPVTAGESVDFVERFTKTFPKLGLQKNDGIPFASTAGEKPDPLSGEQWALKNTAQTVRLDLDDLRTMPLDTVAGEDVALPPAGDLKGLKDITVAVLDTGVDITHPDLRGNLRSKAAECEALTTYLTCMQELAKDAGAEAKCVAKVGNTDRDGNGYPMDCAGWSVTSSLSLDEKSPLSRVLGTPDMDDELGHGTHVAGIIGATRGNGIGIAGVASNVKILPVRVIETPPTAPIRPQSVETRIRGEDEDGKIPDPSEAALRIGKSSVELIARGMLYAIREHVQVINLSLGWPSTLSSDVIEEMVKLAEEQGIAVVAAAGNDSTDSLVLPCSYPGVICVGAYGPDGKRAAYSNRGTGVDLLAPGTSILSTYPQTLRARFYTDLQGYEIMSGTSMSAPMVSGALATLLGKGYSLDESLARMLAGARVTGDAIGENLRLDLAKSLAVRPRPFARVIERAPVRLTWRNRIDVLRGQFHVKNLWTEAAACKMRFRLSPALNTVSGATLDAGLSTPLAETDCGGWKSGETKTFSFPVQVKSALAVRDSILDADLEYTATGGEKFTQTLQVGIQIVPTPELLSGVLASVVTEIKGQPAGQGTMVRTIVAADAKSTYAKPEYVVMSRLDDGIALQVLSARSSTAYEYSPVQKLTDTSWQFLVAQRFYSGEANATRVALFFRKKSDISGLTQIRFDIFDENLATKVRSVTYDGSFAPLPENFRWTRLHGKDAVLFVSKGKEPPSTDVWHPVPDVNVFLRCYVLDSEGVLSEIKVDPNDAETRIVDVLPYRSEDTERGENAVLVIRGRDYRLDYFLGHLKDGVVGALTPFTITPYRNMGTLTTSQNAAPLMTENGPTPGYVLSSDIGRGNLRSTILMRPGYDAMTNDDYRFSPLSPLDGISRVVGAYRIAGRRAFFAQTNWDIQFHEESEAGETIVKTSMNRFSFLPVLVSQRAFFPIIVKTSVGVAEPAILAADIGSGFFNLSTLIPERNAAGKVIGVVRPALLSFEGNESGCSFIGNPIWDSVGGVFRMNSFCNRAIRSVALAIPRE